LGTGVHPADPFSWIGILCFLTVGTTFYPAGTALSGREGRFILVGQDSLAPVLKARERKPRGLILSPG
jgi:hypothetical protein